MDMCGMQCQWRRSSHRKPTIPGHFRNICNNDIEWLEPASAPLKCCGATGLGFPLVNSWAMLHFCTTLDTNTTFPFIHSFTVGLRFTLI